MDLNGGNSIQVRAGIGGLVHLTINYLPIEGTSDGGNDLIVGPRRSCNDYDQQSKRQSWQWRFTFHRDFLLHDFESGDLHPSLH
jgi:hypothetical protein